MLPIKPTAETRAENHALQEMTFHAPPGVPEKDCGDLTAYVGIISGGSFDGGPIIRTYWQLSAEELTYLIEGGVIELELYSPSMPPIALNVFPHSKERVDDATT